MSHTQKIQDLYSAFGRGDIPTVLSLFHADIAWSEAEGNPYMPSGEAWIGPDAILEQLFVRLGSEWEGFTVNPSAYHDAGNTVVVEVRYTGTYLAPARRSTPKPATCGVSRPARSAPSSSTWTPHRCPL